MTEPIRYDHRYDHWRCVTCGRDSLGGFVRARKPELRRGVLFCCECVAHGRDDEQLALSLTEVAS